MAEKPFECARCGRTFAMPAHLARHKNSAHVSAARKAKMAKQRSGRKARKKKTMRRGPGRPPAAGSAARAVSELRAYHRELSSRRADLDAQIASIETALQAMGSGAPKRRGRRKRRR
jgi:uncharacterized C2H2 Zn-finger protein